MDGRSAAQGLWRVARGGLAGLRQILAEADAPEDAVFHAPPPDTQRAADAEHRVAEARKRASGQGKGRQEATGEVETSDRPEAPRR